MKRTLLVCLLVLAGCRCQPPPRPRERREEPPPQATEPSAPQVRALRIRVWDSGLQQDDAFRLAIDGAAYGQSPLGGERVFEVELTRGRHTLTLSGTGAPDGQGTYSIEVAGPLSFESGPPRQGVGLNQGVTFRWEVRVD